MINLTQLLIPVDGWRGQIIRKYFGNISSVVIFLHSGLGEKFSFLPMKSICISPWGVALRKIKLHSYFIRIIKF